MSATDKNLQTMHAFFKAWEQRDLDLVSSFVASDAKIYNIATPPAQTKEEWLKTTGPFLSQCEEIVFEVKHVAVGQDGSYFSERVDKFKMAGKWCEILVAVSSSKPIELSRFAAKMGVSSSGRDGI